MKKTVKRNQPPVPLSAPARKEPSFPTIGRRLVAALISYHLRYSGVDRVLKEDVDKPASDFWEEKGMELLRLLQEQTISRVFPKKSVPTQIQ